MVHTTHGITRHLLVRNTAHENFVVRTSFKTDYVVVDLVSCESKKPGTYSRPGFRNSVHDEYLPVDDRIRKFEIIFVVNAVNGKKTLARACTVRDHFIVRAR